MDSLRSADERSSVVRRLTIAEFAEILGSVVVPPKKAEIRSSFHSKSKPLMAAKARNFISKAVALGVPEKILALVARCPEWGTKKLADSLRREGISLSRQSIHKFLVKNNLNRLSLRKSWKDSLKRR